MSSDPCLKAALAYVRPLNRRPWYVRFWNWYSRVTGYEKAMLQRNTGLRIQSTWPPPVTPKPPAKDYPVLSHSQEGSQKMNRPPSLLRRFWNWYCRITGYEKQMFQYSTDLRIQSTCHPPGSPPPAKKDDFLKGII